MRKKVLSVLTVLSMLLSMMPTFAMAADLSYDESAVGLYVEEDAEITESVEGLVVVTAPVNVSVKDVELSDGLVLTAEAAGANVTVAGESSVGAIVVLCEATVKVEEKAAVAAVTVAAPATVEVAGKADAVVVIETAAGAAVTVAPTATVSAVELSAPGVKAEVAGTVNTLTVAATAESAAITVAETATVAAVEVAAPNVTTEVAGKVESVTVAETATGAEIVVSGTAEITTVTDATGEVTVSGEGAEKVEVAPTQPTQPAQPTQPTQPSTPSTPSEEEPEPEEPSHTHSYTEEITKEATCSEDGVKTFTCSCGDTYTEVIPATGEHPVASKTVTKKPTCTEAGTQVTKYSCACPDFEEPIPALGHNIVNGVCDRCGWEDPDATKVTIDNATVNGPDTAIPEMVVTFTVKNVNGVAKVVCEVKVGDKEPYKVEMGAEQLGDGNERTIVVSLYDKSTVPVALVAEGDEDGTDEPTTPATTVTYTVTVTAKDENDNTIASATKEVVVKNDGTVEQPPVTTESCEGYKNQTEGCTCTETECKEDCPVCHPSTEPPVTTESCEGYKNQTDGCTCTETECKEDCPVCHPKEPMNPPAGDDKTPCTQENPGEGECTCTADDCNADCPVCHPEEPVNPPAGDDKTPCTQENPGEGECTCTADDCNANCPVCNPGSGDNNSGTSDTGNEGDGTGGSGSEGTGDTDPDSTLR